MMKYILILIGSLLVSFYGLGLSYRGDMTPIHNRTLFSGIHPDGWIEDGAKISLQGLLPYGNRLKLVFDPWRPNGNAILNMKVCGKQLGAIAVISEDPIYISLKGKCDPREVIFNIENTFSTETDQRKLGVKLKYAQVDSKLGVPIVETEQIILTAAMIAFLSILAFVTFNSLSLAVIIELICFWFLYSANGMELNRERALAFLLIALVGGYKIAEKPLNTKKECSCKCDSFPYWTIIALIICAIGAAIRIYGLDFGLPFNHHPDEVPKVYAIQRMRNNGNFDPQYFLHPSLLLYSAYFVNTIFLWVHDFSWWNAHGLTAVTVPGDQWLATVTLAGRTVSMIAGTISIFLVYCIGKRLYSPCAGALASMFLAIFPLHVICSRYMKEDALMVFMLLATTAAMLKAVQEDKKFFLFVAGLFAGFSFSTKYTGILSICILGTAPWMRSGTLKPDFAYIKYTAMAALMMPIGFLICTPYSILNYQKFLRDFESERNHATRGHTIPITAWSQYWMYHFSRSFMSGMGIIATFFGIVGVGIALRKRKMEDLFLIAMLLLFYLPAEWVKSKPAPQPERYILPCLPFMAIALAQAVRTIRMTSGKGLAILVLLSVLLSAGCLTYKETRQIKPDTRDQMAQWMLENLPEGAKVYADWKRYAPNFVHQKFQVTYIPRAKIVELLQVKNLKEADQEYLVLSSLFYDRYFSEQGSPAGVREIFRRVRREFPIVKEFKPDYRTVAFHNPTVTLYKLK